MTKSDLRTGMVVEDAIGAVGVVLLNTATVDGIKWFYDEDKEVINYWEELNIYNEDLTVDNCREADVIVKVFQPHKFNDYTTLKAFSEEYLIWDRYEKITENIESKEVTMKDIEEKFGCKVKIIG